MQQLPYSTRMRMHPHNDNMSALVGRYDLEAHCVPCNRYVDMLPNTVLRRYGDIDINNLERRLRCKKCRKKYVIVILSSFHPRPSNIVPFPRIDKETSV